MKRKLSEDDAKQFESLDDSDLSKRRRFHRIILNVGGKKFHTSMDTLRSHGNSYFSNFRGEYLQEEEIFIDRSPKHFEQILNYLRCGEFVTVQYESFQVLAEMRRELEYYQLAELNECIHNQARDLFRKKLERCTDLDELESIQGKLTAFKFANEETKKILMQNREKLQKTVKYEVGNAEFFLDMKTLNQERAFANSGCLLSVQNKPANHVFKFRRDPKHFPLILRAFTGRRNAGHFSQIGLRDLMDYSLRELKEISADAEFYEFDWLQGVVEDCIFWKQAPSEVSIRGRAECKTFNRDLVCQTFVKHFLRNKYLYLDTKNCATELAYSTDFKESGYWMIRDFGPGDTIYAKSDEVDYAPMLFQAAFSWSVLEENGNFVSDSDIYTHEKY